ncbi:MAG: 16S rRNA (cytosine(967)-C(5))-methyltransferase RsmB [candidate division NC10 bacterium]|nr:16S rRNA (cytosine(967)-C(5))-methyltransferase RsmB [candidate division NC10 bacterium]
MADGSRQAGPATARGIAFEVLRRVEATEAYANLLLDARLGRARLSLPDRALVTHLVYGVLRWRGRLDWILAQVLDRPLAEVEPRVRHVLRLGAYQLCCLDRVPAFAAVDESVSLSRTAGATRSAAFVNAVLRAVARRAPFPEPSAAEDPVGFWSSVGSHPPWLAERWIARYGPGEAGRLMAANNEIPPVTVIANPQRIDPESLRRSLSGAGREIAPGRMAPGIFHVTGGGALQDLPGYAEGHFVPMDEAGILPVLALDLAPGQRVLDACAGGGGKSALIAARVGREGVVTAVDVSPRAIRRLSVAAARLGLEFIRTELQDARTLGRSLPGEFPRVLLDAPCTGLGTLRRRPEIKWRRRPADVTRAATLQAELLAGVAGAVAPGGLLVYSTCSLEPEETEAVIAGFLGTHREFRPADPPAAESGTALAELADPTTGFLRSIPHIHGSDGFFIARLTRTC